MRVSVLARWRIHLFWNNITSNRPSCKALVQKFKGLSLNQLARLPMKKSPKACLQVPAVDR